VYFHCPCVKIQNVKTHLKIKQKLHSAWRFVRNTVLVIALSILLVSSTIPVADFKSQINTLTRRIEFDFGTWTLEAIFAKLLSWGLGIEHFLKPQSQSELVLNYLSQVQRVNTLNAEIINMYTDPAISNAELESQSLRETLNTEQDRLNSMAPLAEAILQAQLMTVINESGLGFLGQTFPPSLYQVSDVPQSLIVSPRTEIRQVMDVSLSPSISIEDKEQLENAIFSDLDHSALVVPVGGIGTYPTMIMQTDNLVWLTEVIAHEWVHNFLSASIRH